MRMSRPCSGRSWRRRSSTPSWAGPARASRPASSLPRRSRPGFGREPTRLQPTALGVRKAPAPPPPTTPRLVRGRSRSRTFAPPTPYGTTRCDPWRASSAPRPATATPTRSGRSSLTGRSSGRTRSGRWASGARASSSPPSRSSSTPDVDEPNRHTFGIPWQFLVWSRGYPLEPVVMYPAMNPLRSRPTDTRLKPISSIIWRRSSATTARPPGRSTRYISSSAGRATSS